jgi:hypothetical protein
MFDKERKHMQSIFIDPLSQLSAWKVTASFAYVQRGPSPKSRLAKHKGSSTKSIRLWPLWPPFVSVIAGVE